MGKFHQHISGRSPFKFEVDQNSGYDASVIHFFLHAMKLKTQILGLGLVGLVSAALVGGAALLNATQLATAFDNSIQMSLALQKSQEADMMHDAIRGDVLLALLSAQTKDTAGLAEAQKDLPEHAETFSKAISSMKALPLTEEAKAVVEKVGPALKDLKSTITTVPSSALS